MEELFDLGIPLKIEFNIVDAFIMHLRSLVLFDHKVIGELKIFLVTYPDVMSVQYDENGSYELQYLRLELVKIMHQKFPLLHITAFERGLKHLGFKVMQTTHDRRSLKIFKLYEKSSPITFKRRRLNE
jgi:hypothetical protein